jgi:sulfonate transport system ATP-binding protein
MSGGSAIRVEALTKAFGDKMVLKEMSFTINAGDFVSIVGKSGCGKSTLLRLLIGLETKTTGAIVSDAAQAARLVFQEPRLLPWSNVIANVAVGLGSQVKPAEAAAKALQALKEVGLGDRGGDWPSQLSGGQRQRVALARALVTHPKLLALDEPLGALDALTRIEMQALLESVWRAQGFTALLVTHDVQEAIVLGDRVLLIEDGDIALDVKVDLPRPRRRGDPAFAALEGKILDRLFGLEQRRDP